MKKNDIEDKLLTAAEVAERLGVSKRWIIKQCAERKIKSTMLGVQYFIRESDLAGYEPGNVGRPRKEETVKLEIPVSKVSDDDLKLIEKLKKKYE